MRDAQPSIEREAMRDTRMAAVEAGIEVAATAWSPFDCQSPVISCGFCNGRLCVDASCWMDTYEYWAVPCGDVWCIASYLRTYRTCVAWIRT